MRTVVNYLLLIYFCYLNYCQNLIVNVQIFSNSTIKYSYPFVIHSIMQNYGCDQACIYGPSKLGNELQLIIG